MAILGLEDLNSPTEPTFPDLLQRLYAGKFQGTVVLHFAGGIPRRVEFPQPVQIALDTGLKKTGT